MVKQAHVINSRCDVQIFSTVHGCGKQDCYCAVSTGMPLTSSQIQKFLRSKGKTLVTGHYQHVIINRNHL